MREGQNISNQKLERYADLLDTRFRIPGTQITFGLDFIIGLFPVVGDIFSLALSGGLVTMMIRKGASGKALGLMMVNIALDAAIGAIPFVGDIFDLFFKANRRNLNLFQDHFEEGKYQGSAKSIFFTLVLILLGCIVLIIWITIKILELLYIFLI